MKCLTADTKNYTPNDLRAEIMEDLDFFESMGYTVNRRIIAKLNSRFSKTLGICRKRDNNFIIEINQDYLRTEPARNVHATIMHEVCHTLPGCFNHGPKWKSVVDIVNATFGFNIARLSKPQTYTSYKYKIICNNCHNLAVYRRKKTEAIKYIQSGYKFYHCSHCNSTNLSVEEVK